MSEATASPAPEPSAGSAGERRPFPARAMIEVTRRCVMRCVHCYITDFSGQEEMSTEEVKSALDQLYEMNCLEVTFTGGEIFCRRDILEILRHARRRHFAIVLYTEATLVDEEVADQLKALAPWRVEVTLLGPDAELHDRLTGIRGSYERTLRGIRLMRERGIRLRGKSVVMWENFDRYRELKALFDSLGMPCTFDPIVSPQLDGSTREQGRRINASQMKALLSDDTLAPGTIMMGTSVYSEALNLSQDMPMCKAGINFVHIDPRGNVLPCIQLPLVAGSLRQSSLRDIWENSELFQRLRRTKIRDLQECAGCDLFVLCYRCPGMALLEDGDAYGPSRTACENAAVRRRIQEERGASREKAGGETGESAGE